MKKALLILFTIIIATSSVFAKRLPPPELESIRYNGLEYNVDYHISPFSEEAVIIITDNSDPEWHKVSRIRLYNKHFIPLKEIDSQSTFINKMKLTNNDAIRFYRDDDQVFELNLKDNSVKRLTKSKALHLFAVELVIILALFLFAYILYHLITREITIRKEFAAERMRELLKTKKDTDTVESLYKNDREFRRRILKRDFAILGFFFVSLVLFFIIMLIIRLLNRP